MINPASLHYLRRTPAAELVDKYEHFSTERFRSPEGIPVVIAARNEETDLPATLVALADSKLPMRPYVIENGSDDRTAEYARRMGAVTLHSPIAQKMASLQHGVNIILQDHPESTVLFTDADTLVGRKWSGTMFEKALVPYSDPEKPVVVCGSAIIAHGSGTAVNGLRTMRSLMKDAKFALSQQDATPHGYNMAVRFDASGAMHSAYNALQPNLFIGEENAICNAAEALGGNVVSAFSPRALAVTMGDRFGTIGDLAREALGRASREERYADYGNFVQYEAAS